MKKRKVVSLAVAGTLAVSVMLAGTYAWQSLSQKARNEVREAANPGARLHDDFNFTADGNKDVYVENFMKRNESGVAVYARIRLDEYLEIGQGAGQPTGTEGKQVTKIAKPGTTPDFDLETTWATYTWDREKTIEEEGAAPTIRDQEYIFRQYVLWNQTSGQPTSQPYYMPTFNKNKDSKMAERNGTLEGKDGQGSVPYDDNIVYTAGQQITNIAIYDADRDTTDETLSVDVEAIINALTTPSGTDNENRTWNNTVLLPSGTPITEILVGSTTYPLTVTTDQAGTTVESVEVDLDKGTVEDGNDIKLVQETHSAAQMAESAQIMSMDAWVEAGKQIGNYWVYDEDGWVYWAKPIEPGETTGLLLDKIELREDSGIEDEYYYAINVVAQFSTKSADGTWTEFTTDGDTVSGDAKLLLNKISKNATENYTVEISSNVAEEGGSVKVKQEEDITLTASSQMRAVAANKTWKWTVKNKDGETSLAKGTEFTAQSGTSAKLHIGTAESIGDVLEVTVTYTDADGNYGSGTFDITVAEGTKTAQYRQEIKTQAANVTAGTFSTYTTVTIDGQEWYIVATEKDESENLTKALLYAKSSIDTTGLGNYQWTDGFGKSIVWKDSYIRAYLNSTGDYAKENSFKYHFQYCNALAQDTSITTRKSVDADKEDSNSFISTTDKVFLLSEADMHGKFEGELNTSNSTWSNSGSVAKDFTVVDSAKNGIQLFSMIENRKDTVNNNWSWLRSPRHSRNYLAIVNISGAISGAGNNDTRGGLRPAFWVDLTTTE